MTTDYQWCPQCQARSALSSLTEEVEALVNAVRPGTRHHTLLNSNQPPDDSDIGLVRSVISKTDAPLARLDDEISRLRNTLKGLEEERALLLGHRTRNKAIISVLRRIPTEVLGEIFLHTLPPTFGAAAHRRRTLNMGASPWVLTHISAHWRTVASSTPSLWSVVDIAYTKQRGCPLFLIEAQVQRARTLKIHFLGHPEAEIHCQIQMLQLLLKHSERWEELSLGLIPEMVPSLTGLRERIPSLKKLWIQSNGLELETEDLQVVNCFQTAPSLVEVGICNDTWFLSAPFPFPSHQLTHYRRNCSRKDHEGLLKLAPNLIEARIDIDDDEEPQSTEILAMLHLRRLYISDPDFLDLIEAPA
ncbi:hypothetical protein DFH06DRAFT_517985 [Mycena polygramma]|nr:hypothetical protein DFH06DRAFT_517985 [Mycena polygramma]